MNHPYYISLPYIYPICPLNIDHARMFIIGDIIARHLKSTGQEVYFPIASHYSGNTAQAISEKFKDIYVNKNVSDIENRKILKLYEDIYNTPDYILKNFDNPFNILDYYSQEIMWELKSLNIECDYDLFYTTNSEDFTTFVNVIISLYQEKKVLINDGKIQALNYDSEEWKKIMLNLLNNIIITKDFHKKNIIAATKDIRSDWVFIRDNGCGAKYGKWIIDPMFDSELFTIFNIYIKLKKECPNKITNPEIFFKNLFAVLSGKTLKDDIIKKFVNFLPCDVFICEEHLKNWVIKKIYSESLLLKDNYCTKKYFITGMGLLNGKRMSASTGNAILAKDIINLYGSTRARLIILLTGGHPSKIYRYDTNLPIIADKMLRKGISYISYLLTIKKGSEIDSSINYVSDIEKINKELELHLNNGYYKKMLLELLGIIPKKFKQPNQESSIKFLFLYKKYLDILLPEFFKNFNI